MSVFNNFICCTKSSAQISFELSLQCIFYYHFSLEREKPLFLEALLCHKHYLEVERQQQIIDLGSVSFQKRN